MGITFYSLLSSILWSSLWILLVHFMRKKPFFLHKLGVSLILGFYLLSVGRMVLPLEFPFTQEISLRGWYSQVIDAVYLEEVSWIGEGWSWVNLGCLCWFVVGFGLLGQLAIRYRRDTRKLTQSSQRYGTAADQSIRKIQEKNGRILSVQVYRCPLIQIPIGRGVFHRKIFLPDRAYEKTDLFYILAHEYTHFTNGDLVVKLATQLYCCVFWWNPLVYLLRRDIGQILEMRCDLAVTKEYSTQQKIDYLQTIVRLLQSTVKTSRDVFPGSASFFKKGDTISLVERFRLVSTDLCPSNRWIATISGVALCLLVISYVFVVQPAYDPPVSDIFTNSSVVTPNLGDVYLLHHKDGTYSFLSESGYKIPLDNLDLVDNLISAGVPVREEAS